MIGIYAIVCLANKRVYIGQSVNIKARVAYHKASLKKGTSHNYLLQRSRNKYGDNSLNYFLLETCEKKDLTNREQYWVDYFETTNPQKGFNIIEPASSGCGELNGNSKLTKKDVEEMLVMMGNSVSNEHIAKKYGVGSEIISNIRCGYAWSHVNPEINRSKLPKLGVKLIESDIVKIRKMIRDGMTYKVIGDMFGVTASSIKAIKSGRTWKGTGEEVEIPSRKHTYYTSASPQMEQIVRDTLKQLNFKDLNAIAKKTGATTSYISKIRKDMLLDRDCEILNYLLSGNTNQDAAIKFGLHVSSISRIKNNQVISRKREH